MREQQCLRSYAAFSDARLRGFASQSKPSQFECLRVAYQSSSFEEELSQADTGPRHASKHTSNYLNIQLHIYIYIYIYIYTYMFVYIVCPSDSLRGLRKQPGAACGPSTELLCAPSEDRLKGALYCQAVLDLYSYVFNSSAFEWLVSRVHQMRS